MHPIAIVAAAVAAVIHGYFFILESLWFMRPAVWARFGLRSAADASIVRSFAYNQGFYNLFLAVGVLIGLGLIILGATGPGRALVFFACGSMVAAGVVLVTRNPTLMRGALIQALPPAVAIIAALALG